jgi:TolB-like protein
LLIFDDLNNMIKSDTGHTVSHKDIQEQVDKICQSPELSSKLQLCRLLKYLVEETLTGREEHLKGYKIGVEVFGKEEGFDPEQNPLVRIHAGRLRRMLRLYYLDIGKNDPVRIEIPKGNYIPVFSPNDYAAEDPALNQEEKKKIITKPTIVVLPFNNLTGDNAKAFFALGFSEELSVELTKFDDLVVLDSIPFSDHSLSESDKYTFIKNEGVRFRVEGNVQLDGDHIKILVRLTDNLDGEQIWAEHFTRDLSIDSLFKIQNDIVAEISSLIGSEYGIIMEKIASELKVSKPQKMETFIALSKYYYFEANQTPDAASDALIALQQAIANDPGSGMAHAMLASLYGNRYMLDAADAESAYQRMIKLADKAIALDPHNITVRIVYVWKLFVCNEFKRFFEEAEKCLARGPLPSLRLGILGFYLSLAGEWERGIPILDKVMHGNISFPLYYFGATALNFYRNKQYTEAFEEALQYDMPTLFWGPMLRIAILGQLGSVSEAREDIDHLHLLKPDFESKARYLVSRFVKEAGLVEHVLEGLAKAGMAVMP